MFRLSRRAILTGLGATILLGGLAACAVRVGGPKPETRRVLLLRAPQGASPTAVAQQIHSADASFAMVVAPADTAWWGAVATGTALPLSGPAQAGAVDLGFLGGPAEGDTTVTLPLQGGDSLILHDALYKVDEDRYLDLLLFPYPEGAASRPVVQAILDYAASDVLTAAAVVLGVSGGGAAADSLGSQLRPAFESTGRCGEGGAQEVGSPANLHVFFGPELQVRCEEARLIEGGPADALLVRMVIRR